MIRRVLLVAVLLTLVPAVAQAQIYAWRDAAGNLVLSDKPKDPSARTYAVASTVELSGGDARGFRLPASREAPPPSPRLRRTAVALAEAGQAEGVLATTGPVSRRATIYDGVIADHASRHSLNPEFVRAVIQAESGFNPRARSAKGAQGLMQLMPQTASEYGVLDAFNPVENIRAGVAYLKSLLVRYNQDESLALAAYNAGPTAVEKYGRTVPPYRETRQYVARIRSATSNAGPPPTRVYRIVETVHGREIVRYTNKPTAGAEVVTSARR
jgi:hypothetical protein